MQKHQMEEYDDEVVQTWLALQCKNLSIIGSAHIGVAFKKVIHYKIHDTNTISCHHHLSKHRVMYTLWFI